MQKRAINNENDFNIKSGRIEQACARYGLGRNTMRKVAEEAGAEMLSNKFLESGCLFGCNFRVRR